MRVLEPEPCTRLSYTWSSFTKEWAEQTARSQADLEQLQAEPRSKVTFTLEPQGDMVKLTVVHDGFAAGGLVQHMISGGWPRVLSNLKTLLETGDV